MLKLLKLLLTYQFRNSQPSRRNSGFTLIELLVGLILAFLVIIPLLGFMVNLLSTDRQEQAKANTEQEIQAALNYIARDLDQAVYIYDGYGVDEITDQLPQVDNGVPVLVFWKRQFIPKVIPTATGANCPDDNDRCDDAFVYALVAYYLQRDPTCATTNTWSCTARISRIQLRDAVSDERVQAGDERAQKDDGFKLFQPERASSVEAAMNAWEKGDEDYNKEPEVLIDYIDQTPETTGTLAAPIQLPKASCPSIVRETAPPATTLDYTITDFGPQQSPSRTALTNKFTNPITGFYACVDTEKNSAQVFIRGNALARIRSKTSPPPTYVYSQHTYFPKGSIQVKKRGLFNIQKGG